MSCKFHGPLLALWSIKKHYSPLSKVTSQSYRLICSYEDYKSKPCGPLAGPSSRQGLISRYEGSKSKPCGPLAGPSARQVFNTLLSRQDGLFMTAKVFYCSKKPIECDDNRTENVPKKMSIFQKFKAMYRDYWYVLVPVHLVTSAVWFGSFYYMASSGVDIASLAEMIHLSETTVEKIRANSNTLAGHLAVAYLLYKIFTPLRYTVTVGGTTISINYLKEWGYIKPIPKKEEFKKLLEEKRVSFRKKRDNFRVKKDLMKKSVFEKLAEKKRPKKPNEIIKKVLQNKRLSKNG